MILFAIFYLKIALNPNVLEKKRWDKIILHIGSNTKKLLGISACLTIDYTIQLLCSIQILLKLMTKVSGPTFHYNFFGGKSKCFKHLILNPTHVAKVSEQKLNFAFFLFSLMDSPQELQCWNPSHFRGRLCTLSILSRNFSFVERMQTVNQMEEEM